MAMEKPAEDARLCEGDDKKSVIVHYDGKWRDEPVFESGWGTPDYIMARTVVLNAIEGDKLSISSLTKCVGKAATNLKTHAISFTAVVKGKKKVIKTEEDLMVWWAEGDVDVRGRPQIYLDHVAPYRPNKRGVKGNKSSQPEPIFTPSQPSQEVPPPIVEVHTQGLDGISTLLQAPRSPAVGTQQSRKTMRRSNLCNETEQMEGNEEEHIEDNEAEDQLDWLPDPEGVNPDFDEMSAEAKHMESNKAEHKEGNEAEAKLDWLPDPEAVNPDIDEMPIVEEYYSGYSSSDYEFNPEPEGEESDSDNISLVSEGSVIDDDSGEEHEVVDQENLLREFAGVGENMDNLYDEDESKEHSKKTMQCDVLVKGMEWQTLHHCRRDLRRHAVLKGFEIKYIKNDKTRVRARCVKGCSFFYFASKIRKESTFKLRKFVEEHTCGLPGLDFNKVVTCRFVAEELEDAIKAHKMNNYKPVHIIEEFWKEFTVKISYWVAWRARTIAMEKMFGNYEDGYKKIPELCRQLKLANLGCIGEFTTLPDKEDKPRFNGLCVGFICFLEGFGATCRPLVGLDGCFLKGKYGGCCLAATALDGNNGLYPLAIYICDGETYDNWYDFLEIIAPYIEAHPKIVSFISDRQKGLLDAVEDVFKGHPHRYCFRHYYQNFKKLHKGDHLMHLAWGAAKAYTKTQYEEWAEQILKVDPDAYNWLHNQTKVTSWARSHFDLEANCEHITNNFSESFNKWILELRELHVVSLVDKFHLMLMSLMYERRMKARQWSEDGLVPRAHKIIENHKRDLKFYRVHGAHDHLYSVTEYNTVNRWTVDIVTRSCSCNVWDVTGLPCVHGVAVLNRIGKLVIGYCSDYHKVSTYLQTYSGFVRPMAPMQEWSVPTEVVLEPKQFRGVGRPKKQRIRAYNEKPKGAFQVKRKCGYCGQKGHNRRGCLKAPREGPRPKVQRRNPKGKFTAPTTAKDHYSQPIPTHVSEQMPFERASHSQPCPSTSSKRPIKWQTRKPSSG